MGRRAIPSTTLSAAVRKYFGLTQEELGHFLGVSRGQVAHAEAGRRLYSPATLRRLGLLADMLPPDLAPPEPDPAPDAAPTPTLLLARLDACRHEAQQLRRTLRQQSQQQRLARRWQQVLPILLAATPTANPTRQWLLDQQAEAATTLGPDASADFQLLRLRAEALETEAAALQRLLPPDTHG